MGLGTWNAQNPISGRLCAPKRVYGYGRGVARGRAHASEREGHNSE
jgi:hypothetical protein